MIDADLYQILTLGLLGLILLVGLLTYSAIAALRKSGGVSQVQESAAPAAASTDYGTAQVTPQAAATPIVAEVAPVAQTTAAQPVATAAPVAAAAAVQPAAGEPQDQPFERDGRWWFRRGTELLVYDERTGQWVAAPAEGGAGAGGTAAAGAGVATATVAGEAGGAFWKCPSCGAVNGATATTCRMCFTARP